jgi:integrase
MLGLDISGAVFSPAREEEEHNARRRAGRKTPLYPSHQASQERRKAARGRRPVGECYTIGAYRQAIHRACARAGLEKWSPHQLRHARADEVERALGPEGSKASLGHATLDATKLYLNRDLELARAIARKIG